MATPTLSAPRFVIGRTTVLLIAIVSLAALTLGFGLRVWTEPTAHREAPTIIVQHDAPTSPAPVCRIGRPC